MLTPAILVRLKPAAPWRIGPDSGSMTQAAAWMHSDAVFGALCEAFSHLGSLEEWLAAAAPEHGRPACGVSSAFPFQRTALYVPPPAGTWPPAALSSKQRWKGASLVPVSALRSLMQGETLDENEWFVDPMSGCLVPTGIRAANGPFRVFHRSYAAVDRLDNGRVAPRTVACTQFAPGSGLWFAVTFASQTAYAVWSPRIQAALRLLADTGIGGLRSIGFGRSRPPQIQAGPLEELLLPGVRAEESKRGWWLLSLFNPSPADKVDWTSGHYELVERSGRSQGLLKQTARMVGEGSVLISPQRPEGRCLDVTPNGAAHRVLRPGFAVSIPIPWQVEA